MAESAQKVLHELTAAGLLSSDQVTKYGEQVDTGSDALLSRLVQDGLITQYQSDKFKAGNASDIHFGDYVVIDKLGQGGMGTVLLARHRRMDRQVAIKVLPVTVLESKNAVARFYQEVKVAGQLTHPNIVHAYDAGEHHGFHYLVMEYVKGHDLAQVLTQLGPIPAPLALDYILQASRALEYAHGMNIVHRDIKPSNILLDEEGKIKLLDMGLARIGGALDQEASLHLTTTGQVMGTVDYMSPEQAEDTRQADARSDIYSLGCTLYRLLTTQGPFSRETIVKTILAHRDARIPTIETGSPDDVAINQLFQKMVAKDPVNRFQSVTRLIEAIRQIEEGQMSIFETDTTTHVPDTAAVVRFENHSPDQIPTPDAIIPGGVEEPIGNVVPNSVVSVTSDYGKKSEMLSIPSILSQARPLRHARNWVKANRSRGILLYSIVAVALIGMPSVSGLGGIIGWFTWRAANQDLKDISEGKRTANGYWMTRTGKYLSIFAAVSGVLVWFGWVTFVSSGK